VPPDSGRTMLERQGLRTSWPLTAALERMASDAVHASWTIMPAASSGSANHGRSRGSRPCVAPARAPLRIRARNASRSPAVERRSCLTFSMIRGSSDRPRSSRAGRTCPATMPNARAKKVSPSGMLHLPFLGQRVEAALRVGLVRGGIGKGKALENDGLPLQKPSEAMTDRVANLQPQRASPSRREAVLPSGQRCRARGPSL
jgi:hypothetical protein